MDWCCKSRFLPLLPWAGLLAVLLLGGEVRAQGKKKNPPAEQAARQEGKLKETEVLTQAYILMAMGDHDYDGHRVKAMHQVHQAVEILDKSILKKGTNGQKTVALQEEIAAARAKFIEKHSATIHESQALSDLQMREAATLLAQVRGALAGNKQERPLKHVDAAIKEVNIALKIR